VSAAIPASSGLQGIAAMSGAVEKRLAETRMPLIQAAARRAGLMQGSLKARLYENRKGPAEAGPHEERQGWSAGTWPSRNVPSCEAEKCRPV